MPNETIFSIAAGLSLIAVMIIFYIIFILTKKDSRRK